MGARVIAAEYYTPKSYHRAIGLHVIRNKAAAIFADPGLGKTGSLLMAWKAMRATRLAKRCLLIAPKRVATTTWPDEVAKWEQFNDLDYSVVCGDELKRLKALAADAELYLINPANIAWLQSVSSGSVEDELRCTNVELIESAIDDPTVTIKKAKQKYNTNAKKLACLKTITKAKRIEGLDTLLIDESTEFKTWGTGRFKAIKKMIRGFNRRYIMTGTPAPNTEIDLYAQIYLLDLGESLGKNITEFRKQYCYKDHFHNWILYDRSPVAIREAIAHMVLRLDREDYFDLPEVITNDVWLEMTPKFAKQYKTLEDKLFLELEGGDILTPGSAGTTYNLCKQITNGGLYIYEEKFLVEAEGTLVELSTLSYREQKIAIAKDRVVKKKVRIGVEEMHDAKTKAAADIIAELNGKPAMIVYQFDHDRARLVKEFGPCPTINGKTSTKASKKIVDDWNAKKIPKLLCQPLAMSHGLNMQYGGKDIIWYGLTERPDIYQQVNQRIDRQGNSDQVRIHRLMMRNTVDEAVLTLMENLYEGQKSLLDALNEYRRGTA